MASQLELSAPAFCQAFHPNQPYYIVCCVDGSVKLFKHDDDCRTFTLYIQHKEAVSCRAVAFYGDYLAYGLRSGEIVIRSVVGFVEACRTVVEGSAPVTTLLWVDDKILLAGFDDGKIRIYNRMLTKLLKDEITEFDVPVSGMVLHQNGTEFYAVGGGQLGLFNLLRRDHGTRLLAMSDVNEEDIEDLALFENGRRIVCACSDFGLAIFHEGDLGCHKERLSGLRAPLHSVLKVNENFLLAGGETGQVIIGQLSPNQWCGVFDELTLDQIRTARKAAAGEKVSKEAGNDDNISAASEEDVTLSSDDAESDDEFVGTFSIDSMVCDHKQKAVALIDNSQTVVIVRPLAPALAVMEGESVGVKTGYADFMDEL